MPTYDYQCNKCGKKFEVFQKMSDPHVKICILCKKGKVERLIGSGSGLIFKGTGFYITDYKKADSSTKKEEKSSPKPKVDK